jgi:hypothetical protein
VAICISKDGVELKDDRPTSLREGDLCLPDVFFTESQEADRWSTGTTDHALVARREKAISVYLQRIVRELRDSYKIPPPALVFVVPRYIYEKDRFVLQNAAAAVGLNATFAATESAGAIAHCSCAMLVCRADTASVVAHWALQQSPSSQPERQHSTAAFLSVPLQGPAHLVVHQAVVDGQRVQAEWVDSHPLSRLGAHVGAAVQSVILSHLRPSSVLCDFCHMRVFMRVALFCC